MKKPGLSAATEVAAVVTAATAQREVQPAVTDSQVKMVSHCVFTYICIHKSFDHLLLNCSPQGRWIFFAIYCFVLHCYRAAGSFP